MSLGHAEDVSRIRDEIQAAQPDVIVSFGGRGTIDAAKAAEVLRKKRFRDWLPRHEPRAQRNA